jgi:NAD(P)H-flavin reductase
VVLAVLLIGGGIAFACKDFFLGKAEGHDLSVFSAFTIISKEQVSPTAFILTVRADSTSGAISPARVQNAWKHGLWSVEIKQPQLQIARHYTPLPPLSSTPEGSDSIELRFLIRKMDGGEMSNYLSRRGLGDTIWLRGPHLGFDVVKRLGGADNVVFLAGGTGISPALQIAHRLLDDAPQDAQKPSVSILWANRRAVDALGRQERKVKTGFLGLWISDVAVSSPEESNSSLSNDILGMKRKHPNALEVKYFVDEEKTLISPQDVASLLGKDGPSARSFPKAEFCLWHSQRAAETLPGDDDSTRGVDSGAPCTCIAESAGVSGKNLICVSGPDGFIGAYAGPKRWHGGFEMQGPVQGLLGQMKNGSKILRDWLVLKL